MVRVSQRQHQYERRFGPHCLLQQGPHPAAQGGRDLPDLRKGSGGGDSDDEGSAQKRIRLTKAEATARSITFSNLEDGLKLILKDGVVMGHRPQ